MLPHHPILALILVLPLRTLVSRGAVEQAIEDLFSEEKSLTDLFGPWTGAIMQQKILSAYRVGDGNVTFPFFAPGTTTPTFKRHLLNQRRQQSVNFQYVKGVLMKGIIPGVASEPWLVHSSAVRSYPYLAITWGSRGAAVYKAVQIDAKNPYVAQTLENGVQDATLLHERTPSKALRWLRDYSNQFHMGSSSSFIDKMQECVTIQDDWGVAKKDNGWTARLLGGTQEYDKKFRSWFEETSSEFGEWELLQHQVLDEHSGPV